MTTENKQSDELAAFDLDAIEAAPLVDAWIRSRGTSMDGTAYAAAIELAAFVLARATTQQANKGDQSVALSDAECELLTKIKHFHTHEFGRGPELHSDAIADAYKKGRAAAPQAVTLSDEQIKTALAAWFDEETTPQSFEARMRRALLAARKGDSQ